MSKRKNLVIIGQGYVGLPLAMSAVKAGWSVTGIDTSTVVVNSLQAGKSHIEDISDKELQHAISAGFYVASQSSESVSNSEICIFCVPTPLGEGEKPNLNSLESAIRNMAPYLKAGTLLINESTSYPGTLRDFILPLICNIRPDLNKHLRFASAPERIDPRNIEWSLFNTPRLIAGIDEFSTTLAIQFYESICKNVIEVSSPEVAEMSKLLENTFRQVNIALVNQLVPFCDAINIDIFEVIEAASSKPYGFMKFLPGAGVGGHCIPIDPLYMHWKAKELGIDLNFIWQAHQVNSNMPNYVTDRLISLANLHEPATVAILGVAYKSGISDIRESPAEKVAHALIQRGHKPVWSDPLVQTFHGFEKYTSQNISASIIVTAQRDLPISLLSSMGVPILDCTGSFKSEPGVSQL